MAMSRKNYVAVAAVIKQRFEILESMKLGDNDQACVRSTIANIAQDLARVFANDNPQFQRGRFLEACGVSQ